MADFVKQQPDKARQNSSARAEKNLSQRRTILVADLHVSIQQFPTLEQPLSKGKMKQRVKLNKKSRAENGPKMATKNHRENENQEAYNRIVIAVMVARWL